MILGSLYFLFYFEFPAMFYLLSSVIAGPALIVSTCFSLTLPGVFSPFASPLSLSCCPSDCSLEEAGLPFGYLKEKVGVGVVATGSEH